MKTFDDLVFNQDRITNGLHAVIKFANNYGVSVVRFKGTYGYELGLWEVAILYGGEITYNTDLANNVLGFMTEQDVTDIMRKVQKL